MAVLVAHGGRVEALLAEAEEACARRGAQLTQLRRQVLRLVLEAGQPIGAYALPGAAPPTVYRALDFLLEHGLIHKVERLNAFIGCNGASDDHCHGHGHDHPHQFLICSRCGRTAEVCDTAVASAVAAAAGAAGFMPVRMTLEIEGVCESCLAG
jgi:Fur family zinc uptake transcriptional regulator